MDELWLIAALVLALAVRTWVAELICVKGKSMASTLHNGDILGTTRFDYRTKPPQRQNVVICYYPGRYLRRCRHVRQCFVKRVIVYINGHPLSEPYLDPMHNRRSHHLEPVTLAEDEVFVLGDNRDNSNDSRRVGPLKRTMLRGHVRCVLWPPRRWGRVN